MIDICFSDSIAGIVRYLLGTSTQFALEIMEENHASYEAKEVFAQPACDIYSFPLWFDRAEIDEAGFEKGRLRALKCLNNTDGEVKRQYDKYMKSMGNVVKQAQGGMPIRIWSSWSAFDLCGLYYFSHLLKNADTTVCVVPLPENEKFLGWPQMEPEMMPDYFGEAHKVQKAELYRYADEWERLCAENAALRVTVNGRVTSVDEIYYDDIIYHTFDTLEEDVMSIQSLIGNSITGIWAYSHNIIDSNFVLERTLTMIEQGRLTVCGEFKPNTPYNMCPPYIVAKAPK